MGDAGYMLALMPGTAILLVVGALLLQAFFAGYETGLVSLNILHVEEQAARGRRSAILLRRMLKRPDRVLAMCLIGTNLAVVFGTLVMVAEVGRLWTLAVYTPVVLVLGELVPKSLFRHYATTLSMALVYVARAFELILGPLVFVIGGVNRAAAKAMGHSGEFNSPFLTREDMSRLVVQGEASGTIETEERKLIHGVMALSATMAKEVMVPRTNVVAVSKDATERELIETFRQSGHTRLPVFSGTLDNIIGVVNLYDLLKQGRAEPDRPVSDLVCDMPVVPDTKNVGELLYEMRTQRIHMAAILDEYGGTAGIVTIEDLVEEVFGEIEDEYDSEEPPILRTNAYTYRVFGNVDIDDLSEELGIKRPDGEFETVAGFVMDLAGKIPKAGDVYYYETMKITVLDADDQGIETLQIEVEDPHGDRQKE